MTRVLTALVLVPLVLAAVVWAPAWLFAMLLALLALAGAHEFYGLAAAAGQLPYRWLGGAVTAVLVLDLSLPLPTGTRKVMALLLALLLAVLLRALAHPERMEHALADAGSTLLGVFYPGLLLGTVGAIRLFPLGSFWLIFLLLVVWLGDTAALYGGRWLGRHPMAPRVSPKKTWEGATASLLVAAWVGVACAIWQGSAMFVALAVAMNLAAQVGDLVESQFKRGARVKDSGRLLPGHGGVLDRVDAMLFAAPLLWYYLAYLRL